jgi:hypothetical protein
MMSPARNCRALAVAARASSDAIAAKATARRGRRRREALGLGVALGLISAVQGTRAPGIGTDPRMAPGWTYALGEPAGKEIANPPERLGYCSGASRKRE